MVDKKISNVIIFALIIIAFSLIINIVIKNGDERVVKESFSEIKATVLSVDKSNIILVDEDKNTYTLSSFANDLKPGDLLAIKYTGVIDESKDIQTIEIVEYSQIEDEKDENGVPVSWKDNGIFSDYYVLANNKLKTLSLDEKIGQVLLARYPDINAVEDLKKYNLGGYIFFGKDFANKTESQVKNMINDVQNNAKIPLLTAVDEEGGTVVRVSSNSNLVSEKFKSPQEIYNSGGFEAIKNDTINKSNILYNLGLNLNLAPVVDVSTDPNDYMYDRTIGQNTDVTSTYAKTVIEASKKTNVSYTLKHFPGYGNNVDTHTSASTDDRAYNDILKNDIPPFEAGIKAGAESVLISHNVIKNIDPNNPASISPSVNRLLTNDLGFTGVVITDDLDMAALDSIDNKNVKSLIAGNNLIITSDYAESFNEIKTAIENGTINQNILDKAAFKVLAWKYYKGLMADSK